MNLTPTESNILNVLGDGFAHPLHEVRSCLSDELSQPSAVYYHISQLRKKIKESGQGIMFSRSAEGKFYQLVRTLSSPYKS